jgi:hypothetical protein
MIFALHSADETAIYIYFSLRFTSGPFNKYILKFKVPNFVMETICIAIQYLLINKELENPL